MSDASNTTARAGADDPHTTTTKHKCASTYCPGYSYRASELAHPPSTCGSVTHQLADDPATTNAQQPCNHDYARDVWADCPRCGGAGRPAADHRKEMRELRHALAKVLRDEAELTRANDLDRETLHAVAEQLETPGHYEHARLGRAIAAVFGGGA